MSFSINRRRLLQAFAASAGAAAAGTTVARHARGAENSPRFLIVLAAFGGGSIIDSFLPIKESETSSPADLDCLPDAEVISTAGTPIRAADATCRSFLGQSLYNPATQTYTTYQPALSPFVAKYKDDMMVTTVQGSSVNHAIAQRRALTGGGSAWGGRTLQEIVALTYGKGLPLPNVNMASLGYLERGSDPTLESFAYGEPVPEPLVKALSVSASRGIAGAPDQKLIEIARKLRNDKLDVGTPFAQTFRNSERLALWKAQRDQSPGFDEANLIEKLIFINDSADVPLNAYGLGSAPETELLLGTFTDLADPLERQAALAYLMIKHRISTTVTLAQSFAPVTGGPYLLKNGPLSFDGSHNDHRATQAVHWFNLMTVAGKLIDLLKNTPSGEEGTSNLWEHTMIHIPTDFGRDKRRVNTQSAADPLGAVWGTGHEMNNGCVTLSPLVNGNHVLGGVNPDTGITHGFDLATGAEDPSRKTSESELFAGLLQALSIDTSSTNLPDVPAMRRKV